MILGNPLIPLAFDLGSADPAVRLRAVRQITQQLPVPGFLETLRKNRLTPLLYQTLTRFSRQEVGNIPHLDDLRRDYLGGLRRCKNQESELHLLLKAFSDAQVEAILLKGADVRHRLYEDPAARPMGDLDILIPPADLEKVRLLLQQQGYRLAPRDVDRLPNFNARFLWEELYASTRHEGVWVDLHWEIRKMGAFYRLPYAALRTRATIRDLNGVTGLVLCPEHLLMNLCLNTLEELEEAGILKLVDLDRALSRLPLNWDLLLEDAAAFHLRGPLFWIFRRMVALRPGAVPEPVLKNLAAYDPGLSEKLILRRGRGSLLAGLLASCWRYLPVREWPSFLKGKFWPEADFIRANPHEFGDRKGYLLHLLRRTQDKT